MARFHRKHKNSEPDGADIVPEARTARMATQSGRLNRTCVVPDPCLELHAMNVFNPKQPSAGLANFSKTKRDILNDIRAKWGKFSEDDLGRLGSNDDLVTEIASRYNIDRALAQSDVDAMMRGRQI
jgi:hypothetical protein